MNHLNLGELSIRVIRLNLKAIRFFQVSYTPNYIYITLHNTYALCVLLMVYVKRHKYKPSYKLLKICNFGHKHNIKRYFHRLECRWLDFEPWQIGFLLNGAKSPILLNFFYLKSKAHQFIKSKGVCNVGPPFYWWWPLFFVRH